MFPDQSQRVCETMFRLLFAVSPLSRQRLSVLCQLVSMAVGIQCRPLLESTAVWMQVCVNAQDFICIQ